uniref:Capsid protein n=1 Tax=Florenciella sp. virus SA2 TaxID=3240092 RepID=A0AB39J6A9_9VIRU
MSNAVMSAPTNAAHLAGDGGLNAPAMVYDLSGSTILGETMGDGNTYNFSSDLSGLIMEFADLEVNVSTAPSYDVSLVQVAGLDVSALAIIDLSCSYHDVSGIFKFTFDSHDASNVDASNSYAGALVGLIVVSK